MSTSRKIYSKEFKIEAVRLWQTTERTAPQVEAELGITPGLLYEWKRKLAANGSEAFPGQGRLTPSEEELRRLRRELEVVRQERDILKKAGGHLLAAKVMRFAFIEAHRAEFPVTLMCRMLAVSPSGYYAWRGRGPSAREMANQVIMGQIETVHAQSHQTYGSPRVWQELKNQGMPCSQNRVARLMRAHGIVAKQMKRYQRTTRANAAHPVAPNHLNGDFSATRPNEKWLADITYIPTQEGWLYLAAVLDLFSRRIVGWAMAERMTSALVERALDMALRSRRLTAPLLHHSDRGSQYTGGDYQRLLADHRLLVSMSNVGHCYDNAPMESFFGTLKTEWVHHRAYQTRQEAKTDLFFYIEGFYNRSRRHSALDYLSPADFEHA
ncbi:MAG: IS3 family transposase, partial [Candidatus Binatia bacterium]